MVRPPRTTGLPPTAVLSLTLLLTLVLASPRAHANDSSALLEAGGIVFTVSKDVSMESEALWISRKLVRVAYVFKNTGPADVKTTVAFPVYDPDYGYASCGAGGHEGSDCAML